LRDRVGHLEAHSLEGADLLAEGLAAFAVEDGDFQSRPSHAEGSSRRGETFRDHHRIENRRAGVHLADQVGARDLHVPKDEPSRSSAACSHELVEILDLDAGPVFLNQKKADPLVRLPLRVRVAVNDEEIRTFRRDDETLLSADGERIALKIGLCRGAEEVRSTPRLRERLSRNEIAAKQGLEEFLLLFPASVGDECLSDDRGHREGATQRCAEDPNLLQGGDLRRPGKSPSAIFLRKSKPQQVPLSQGLHEIPWIADLVPIHLPDQVR